MARRKRFTAEKIIIILREVEIYLGKSNTVKEAKKLLEISEQTYYHWWRELGGMDIKQAKKPKKCKKRISAWRSWSRTCLYITTSKKSACKKVIAPDSKRQAARQAGLDYLQSTGSNISRTSKAFSINRCVVYGILKKQASGDLFDRPREPKHQQYKTPLEI